jgi:diaminopimelate epimerase
MLRLGNGKGILPHGAIGTSPIAASVTLETLMKFRNPFIEVDELHYYKYHALGNDYVVIDPRQSTIQLTPASIRRICHRNFGIGSDGILYGPVFKQGKILLNIYNPDGSEAEKSGNGLRIFVKYLFDSRYISDDSVSISTKGGEAQARILNKDATEIKINMGPYSFNSSDIPVNGDIREVINEPLLVDHNVFHITCVTIGNPHCVVPMDSISKEIALEFGRSIENHPLFPRKINVQFLEIVNRKNIRIEIWERGAGYTLASGSSSCAAACAAHKLGFVDNYVTVHMPGGEISIEIYNDKTVLMSGHVTYIHKGTFSKEFISSLNIVSPSIFIRNIRRLFLSDGF